MCLSKPRAITILGIVVTLILMCATMSVVIYYRRRFNLLKTEFAHVHAMRGLKTTKVTKKFGFVLLLLNLFLRVLDLSTTKTLSLTQQKQSFYLDIKMFKHTASRILSRWY